MRLEDCINQRLMEYPSLYRAQTREESRPHVLGRLFFNNYADDWFDGYICPQEWSAKGRRLKRAKYGKDKCELSPYFFERFIPYEICARDIADDELRALVIKQMGDQRITYTWHPYPIEPRHALANIPDNVRPDWLAGANEICDLAIAFYSNLDTFNTHDTYARNRAVSGITDDGLEKYRLKSLALLGGCKKRIKFLQSIQ